MTDIPTKHILMPNYFVFVGGHICIFTDTETYDDNFKVQISFFEFYGNGVYDLLDPVDTPFVGITTRKTPIVRI